MESGLINSARFGAIQTVLAMELSKIGFQGGSRAPLFYALENYFPIFRRFFMRLPNQASSERPPDEFSGSSFEGLLYYLFD